MAVAPQAAAGEAGEGEEQQSSMVGTVARALVMAFVVSQMLGRRAAPPTAEHRQAQETSGVVSSVSHLSNAWPRHQLFELSVFVSESERLSLSDAPPPAWRRRGLLYASEQSPPVADENVTIRAPPSLLRNETLLYAHIYAVVAGTSADPAAPNFDALGVSATVHPLVKMTKRTKVKATKHLLSGEFKDNVTVAAAAERNEQSDSEMQPHWKGLLSINLVEDFTVFPVKGVPPQVRSALTVDEERGRYLPVIFCSDMWTFNDQLLPINETTTDLTLTVSFSQISLMRWQLTAQMQASLELQASLHGDKAMDDVRRMLGDTSPWLLGLTMLVSVLHSLFDFLAFKNDIKFWKNNKSMTGLSLGSMLLNLFFQTVIFLYLLDNDTSYMILASSGVGLAIEVWKVRKAIKEVRFVKPPGASLPRLRIVPTDSYSLSPTKVHDDEAMLYLSYVMYPLVVGYSLYSLAYETHKSWYSWLLGSVVGCVYTFGFIMMTPQLFINYKLKSTAHMPWKTFMYKALNTFVDDLFAFIIKMPTMHRLSCLRDDVIFLAYLYQRWQYGVDSSRANEFGQVSADETDAAGSVTEADTRKRN